MLYDFQMFPNLEPEIWVFEGEKMTKALPRNIFFLPWTPQKHDACLFKVLVKADIFIHEMQFPNMFVSHSTGI